MNTSDLIHIHAPAFGNRASRIPRALLVHRKKRWGVVELARAVGISQGYAAKVLGLLRDAGVVHQRHDGYILEKARELLDAWAMTRRFGDGDTLQSYTLVGDPASVEMQFVQVARKLNASYALTLMSGAARRAPFVRHPTVHAYLEGDPSLLVRELRGIQVSEGGNLILARPYDEGIFYGVQEIDGVRIVSDVQLYVDLFNSGNRGREQADFILDKCLNDLAYTDSPEARARFLEAVQVRAQADATLQQERDYAGAARLYKDVVGRLALLNTPGAAGELRRAKLLLWTSLVHVAELTLDRSAMEEARSLCVTDHDVEELRREVGYNASHVELALLAYFAALARMATDEPERRRYEEKARTHGTIALGGFTESSSDLGKEAREILVRRGL